MASQTNPQTQPESTKNPQPAPGMENEGEGNKTAARRYDDAVERFAKSGNVEKAAKEAQEALEGEEGEELREAELATRATQPGEEPEPSSDRR